MSAGKDLHRKNKGKPVGKKCQFKSVINTLRFKQNFGNLNFIVYKTLTVHMAHNKYLIVLKFYENIVLNPYMKVLQFF